MPFVAWLGAFITSQFAVVLIPVLITLVGLILNAITNGGVGNFLLSLFMAPVVSALSIVAPDISIQSLISRIPVSIWEVLSYVGITPAVNFFFQNAIILLGGYVSAIATMHIQSFVARRVGKVLGGGN